MSADAPGRALVLSLGSNLGDSLDHLQRAVHELAATADIIPVTMSGVYATAPVGPVQDQPEFRNITLLARTSLEPLAVLERCQAIERAHHRERILRWGPRTLDVDLVAMDDLVLDTEALTLPHPRAHERAFVLVPWLECDPDARLVGHGKVADLVSGLDTTEVRRTDEEVELP